MIVAPPSFRKSRLAGRSLLNNSLFQPGLVHGTGAIVQRVYSGPININSSYDEALTCEDGSYAKPELSKSDDRDICDLHFAIDDQS